MGHALRMVAQGRLATVVQPCDADDSDGGTAKTARIPVFQGLLPSGTPDRSCSVNRRVPGRYARWCERAGAVVGPFLPTRLAPVLFIQSRERLRKTRVMQNAILIEF